MEFTMNSIKYLNGKSEEKHTFFSSNELIFDQFPKSKKGETKKKERKEQGGQNKKL